MPMAASGPCSYWSTDLLTGSFVAYVDNLPKGPWHEHGSKEDTELPN